MHPSVHNADGVHSTSRHSSTVQAIMGCSSGCLYLFISCWTRELLNSPTRVPNGLIELPYTPPTPP